MTREEWQEAVNKLINKNGGWLVTVEPWGRRAKPGDVVPIQTDQGEQFNALVVGSATEEEAAADCAFLGLPFVKYGATYVKVMVD